MRRALHSQGSRRGFTLIELLVVLSIIIVITLVTRFGKTQYERSLLLTNLAYDVALSVREAQVYGINVRKGVGVDPFDVGYGVYFDLNNSKNFVLFVDADNDHFYDGGVEFVRNYTIKSNNQVSELCVVPSGGGTQCNPVTVLGITFRRPDPEACFASIPYPSAKSTNACINATGIAEGRITIKASDGRTRSVVVYTTGQMLVQ